MLSKINYRIEDLTAHQAERALLPAHPAGITELTDAQLDHVGGGIFLPFVLAYLAGGPLGEAIACAVHGDAIPGC